MVKYDFDLVKKILTHLELHGFNCPHCSHELEMCGVVGVDDGAPNRIVWECTGKCIDDSDLIAYPIYKLPVEITGMNLAEKRKALESIAMEIKTLKKMYLELLKQVNKNRHAANMTVASLG